MWNKNVLGTVTESYNPIAQSLTKLLAHEGFRYIFLLQLKEIKIPNFIVSVKGRGSPKQRRKRNF